MLFAVLQLRLPGANGLICLHDRRAALAGQPVPLGLQAGLAPFVVALAHSVVQFLGQTLNGGGQSGKCPGLVLHRAGEAVCHGLQNDFCGLAAFDLTLGDHVVHGALVNAIGVRQHSHRADTPVIEDVQVLQRGLAAGPHTSQRRGHHGHIAGGLPQCRAGISDGLQNRQYLILAVLVCGQRLAHGREVIVEERRQVGHIHQIG